MGILVKSYVIDNDNKVIDVIEGNVPQVAIKYYSAPGSAAGIRRVLHQELGHLGLLFLVEPGPREH